MVSNDSLRKLCKSQVCGVLATVLSTDGLGPAQKGDYLFCTEKGKLLAGTVGGGANEQQVLQACAVLVVKHKVIDIGSLSRPLPSCGGLLQIRLDRLDLAVHEDIAFLTKQQEDAAGARLLLFGAGHVVQELCWLADRNRFTSVVVDPRQELMSSDYFPVNVRLVCCSAVEWLLNADVMAGDYIIIAGPNHATDLSVLEQAATTRAHYIGVMGSKRKIESFTEILYKKSLYQRIEDRLSAPIGLDISSKRPSEVAVSIVAELIAIRAQSLKNSKDLCLQ